MNQGQGKPFEAGEVALPGPVIVLELLAQFCRGHVLG